MSSTNQLSRYVFVSVFLNQNMAVSVSGKTEVIICDYVGLVDKF